MRLSAISTLAGAALIVGASPAFAVTLNSTFDVQVVLTESCSIDSPNAPGTVLDFGTPANLSAPVQQILGLLVTCTNGTDFDVALNNGQNLTRQMRLGATTNYVNYELYTDNTFTTPWPSTVGTPPYAYTGTGAQQTVDIFGEIPSQATPLAGTYTDQIQVTLTY
jgi:spore coat protein U-like protein